MKHSHSLKYKMPVFARVISLIIYPVFFLAWYFDDSSDEGSFLINIILSLVLIVPVWMNTFRIWWDKEYLYVSKFYCLTKKQRISEIRYILSTIHYTNKVYIKGKKYCAYDLLLDSEAIQRFSIDTGVKVYLQDTNIPNHTYDEPDQDRD